MEVARIKQSAIGVAWALAGTFVVFVIYHLVHTPFPFLLLLFVVVSARLGDGKSGYATTAVSTVAAYYFTEPVGWAMTWSGAVSIVLYLASAVAIVQTVVAMERERDGREAMIHAVAHDLKAPLSAAALQEQLVVRQLERGAIDSSPHTFLAHARKMGCQIERILMMIDDLLDSSRLRNGRPRIHVETADLCAIVRDVADRVSPQCESARTPLRVTLPEQPCLGRWDVLFVDRMLTNLVVNAVKYAPGLPIDVSIEQGDADVTMVVADHGHGIPPEAQRSVFEAFHMDASGRAARSSHGLGLWIVRRLAEAHGGSVVLESAVGKGTTVRVSLPRVCDPNALQAMQRRRMIDWRGVLGGKEKHA